MSASRNRSSTELTGGRAAMVGLWDCERCGQIFSSNESLREHERTSPAHRCECVPCGRVFDSIKERERHYVKSPAHRNACPVCATDFSDPAELHRHRNTMHGRGRRKIKELRAGGQRLGQAQPSSPVTIPREQTPEHRNGDEVNFVYDDPTFQHHSLLEKRILANRLMTQGTGATGQASVQPHFPTNPPFSNLETALASIENPLAPSTGGQEFDRTAFLLQVDRGFAEWQAANARQGRGMMPPWPTIAGPSQPHPRSPPVPPPRIRGTPPAVPPVAGPSRIQPPSPPCPPPPPVKETKPESPGRMTQMCPLCLDGILVLTSTTCGHAFCQDCILKALEVKKECPTCRRKMKKGDCHRVYLNME